MAVCVRGMSDSETASLTEAMINSGARLRYPSDWSGLVVGKHSTGGVGDKVSIVLVPALAACGLKACSHFVLLVTKHMCDFNEVEVEQGLTSHQTQGHIGDRFLQVK